MNPSHSLRRQLIQSLVVMALGIILISVFVAIRLSRRILAPLNSVAHSLREVAQGKLDAPGRLTVRLEQAGELCQLSVEDQGPGLPAELAASVFEAFRRGDPSRSQQTGGSGLGLAVVKAIAEAHGGRADCRMSEQGGSIFVIAWPG